ncbi:hypothetical protein B0J12DRAFT_83100 [Macrophomina phaseolina]|uniref:Uncharacterized protein n=1 Tax=Macrophomina phaseolina TaxID=35725 RepID=A0ABQ8GF07_9PEZI|nr:hypothetical protein B0J12DRAFT_83100 [Macrophomina phaseolina]
MFNIFFLLLISLTWWLTPYNWTIAIPQMLCAAFLTTLLHHPLVMKDCRKLASMENPKTRVVASDNNFVTFRVAISSSMEAIRAVPEVVCVLHGSLRPWLAWGLMYVATGSNMVLALHWDLVVKNKTVAGGAVRGSPCKMSPYNTKLTKFHAPKIIRWHRA